MQVKFELKLPRELPKETLEKLVRSVDMAVGKAAHAVVRDAVENLDRNKTNNTGDLRKSIQATRLATAVWKAFVGQEYGVYVEYGTRPHFPPPSEIEKWVVRKLGIKGKEARKAAWAIAQTIARRGTRPQPFWRPAVKNAPEYLERFVQEAVEEVLRR